MGEVTLEVGHRTYTFACRDGEEQHLLAMGEIVKARAADAEQALGPMSENRMLLFAALLLADTMNDQGDIGGEADPDPAPAMAPDVADAVERLADRMEAIAERLENIAADH